MKNRRLLDELVAEKVMGWTNLRKRINGTWILTPPQGEKPRSRNKSGGQPPLHYETRIENAWEVFEKLPNHVEWYGKKHEVKWSIEQDKEKRTGYEYIVIARGQGTDFYCVFGGGYSAPYAICSAALRVVGYDIEMLNLRE